MSTMSGPYDRILGGGGGSVVVGSTGLITLTSPALGTITTEQSSLTQAAQTLTVTTGYTNQRFALFNQPTISAATVQTVANAATVAVVNAPTPTGVGPAAITRPMSLWIQNGQVGIDSASGLSTATTAQVGPAVAVTGAWITGGSATTTKPHILVEPSGTTSTGWSTAGTGIGVNAASGFTGNLLDLQLVGVSAVKVASASIATTVPLTVASSSSVNVNLLTLTQSIATSGTRNLLTATGGAHTGQAIAEENDVLLNLARTVTFTAAGSAITNQRAFLIQAPTYAAASGTQAFTNAATVEITGAPGYGASTSTTGVSALRIGTTGATLNNIAGTAYRAVDVAAHTVVLAATTQVTATTGVSALTLGQVTINQTGGAVTVNQAATLDIVGPPVAGSSVTVTALYAALIRTGNVGFGGKATLYNNVATAGWGQPAIYGYTRPAQQTNTTVTIASYTVGAADGSFIVSANVNVTTSTTVTATVTCTYTDETNVSRTLTMPFILLAGTVVAAITTAQGNVPYEGVPLHIRAKASTSITLATAGTVTNVVYTAEGLIQQVA